jgi:parallel beta-helix repeat protein
MRRLPSCLLCLLSVALNVPCIRPRSPQQTLKETTLMQKALMLLFFTGTIAALTGLGEAGGIDCGAVLGPGGTYVLDRDLTCPKPVVSDYDPDPWGFVGMLNVSNGATLNLNGHTVTCLPSSPYPRPSVGIRLRHGKVKNGTVVGCDIGIVPSDSVVKRITVAWNRIGMLLDSRTWGSHRNLISANIAQNNARFGFYLVESDENVLVNNLAVDNEAGFAVDRSSRTVLLQNVATHNHGNGFSVSGATVVGGDEGGEANQVIENRSVKNGANGFSIGGRSTNIIGNYAKGNGGTPNFGGAGFDITDIHGGTVTANVAIRNVQGFIIRIHNYYEDSFDPSFRPAVDVIANSALRNQYSGIIVMPAQPDFSDPPVPVHLFLSRNVARGNTSYDHDHTYDLVDLNSDCDNIAWLDNTFVTATGSCIQ